ncbi:hypothetical protein MANES_02G202577v8 [Manihot esculenta]|uniref:Uncharacterized protein n=1 Tax=Manihot esculenta TaxID=3983 RepID=A0ACB7IAM6_MANES|nr:hypothetical protein MANES_02G202577v8 [Manihot esculenta]
MMMDPLPCINKTFSLVVQQKRQLNLGLINEPKALVAKSPQDFSQTFSYGRGTLFSFNRDHKRFASQSNIKLCTFCSRMRYTEEICYHKHGFPPSFKFRNNIIASINNNCT